MRLSTGFIVAALFAGTVDNVLASNPHSKFKLVVRNSSVTAPPTAHEEHTGSDCHKNKTTEAHPSVTSPSQVPPPPVVKPPPPPPVVKTPPPPPPHPAHPAVVHDDHKPAVPHTTSDSYANPSDDYANPSDNYAQTTGKKVVAPPAASSGTSTPSTHPMTSVPVASGLPTNTSSTGYTPPPSNGTTPVVADSTHPANETKVPSTPPAVVDSTSTPPAVPGSTPPHVVSDTTIPADKIPGRGTVIGGPRGGATQTVVPPAPGTVIGGPVPGGPVVQTGGIVNSFQAPIVIAQTFTTYISQPNFIPSVAVQHFAAFQQQFATVVSQFGPQCGFCGQFNNIGQFRSLTIQYFTQLSQWIQVISQSFPNWQTMAEPYWSNFCQSFTVFTQLASSLNIDIRSVVSTVNLNTNFLAANGLNLPGF